MSAFETSEQDNVGCVLARTVKRLSGILAHASTHPTGWCWPSAVGLIGLATLLIAAGISWCVPPVPSVHDEFSYLLAADTFRHGRLTNPTHPHWQHFESFHVIHEPTYASKYPPGPGLALALGSLLTGLPITGAWLAAAAAAMATCWMLAGWMPKRYAVLGGLLVALHAGM